MQRRIEMEGITNFRDLGGYRTTAGEEVKWLTLYRSDTLSSLTDGDMQAVCNLGITTAFDLRYGEERALEPSRFLGHDQVTVLEMGLDARPGESWVDSFETATDKAEVATAYMNEGYRDYPFLYADAYREMIVRLTRGERIVVHCTAGKDRAGTAAAMMLTVLGVPRDVVFEDYLLTNQYWDRGNRVRPEMDADTVASIFSAREEYLHAAFTSIEAKCGSVETYIEDVLGLSEAKLAAFRGACLN